MTSNHTPCFGKSPKGSRILCLLLAAAIAATGLAACKAPEQPSEPESSATEVEQPVEEPDTRLPTQEVWSEHLQAYNPAEMPPQLLVDEPDAYRLSRCIQNVLYYNENVLTDFAAGSSADMEGMLLTALYTTSPIVWGWGLEDGKGITESDYPEDAISALLDREAKQNRSASDVFYASDVEKRIHYLFGEDVSVVHQDVEPYYYYEPEQVYIRVGDFGGPMWGYPQITSYEKKTDGSFVCEAVVVSALDKDYPLSAEDMDIPLTAENFEKLTAGYALQRYSFAEADGGHLVLKSLETLRSKASDIDNEKLLTVVQTIMQQYRTGKEDLSACLVGVAPPELSPLPQGWVLPEIETTEQLYGVRRVYPKLAIAKVRVNKAQTMEIHMDPVKDYAITKVLFTDENLGFVVPQMTAQQQKYAADYLEPLLLNSLLMKPWNTQDYSAISTGAGGSAYTSHMIMVFEDLVGQEEMQKLWAQHGPSLPAKTVNAVLQQRFPFSEEQLKEMMHTIYDAPTDSYTYQGGRGGGPIEVSAIGIRTEGDFTYLDYEIYTYYGDTIDGVDIYKNRLAGVLTLKDSEKGLLFWGAQPAEWEEAGA